MIYTGYVSYSFFAPVFIMFALWHLSIYYAVLLTTHEISEEKEILLLLLS